MHAPPHAPVLHARRQLQSLPAAVVPVEPPADGSGRLPNGASAANGSPAGASVNSALFTEATEPLWALLEAAFTHFPRVVLAACIHALKLVDNPALFGVASQFVSVRLLAPRPAAAAAAAATGGGSIGRAADGADPPPAAAAAGGAAATAATAAAAAADGAGSGGGEEQLQPAGPSLFKQVMSAEDREQRWFKQHVQQFLQGG